MAIALLLIMIAMKMTMTWKRHASSTLCHASGDYGGNVELREHTFFQGQSIRNKEGNIGSTRAEAILK